MGLVRAQGRRGPGPRTAVARGGRGAELLRQLGRRRHDDRHAPHTTAGRASARAVGVHRGREPGRRVPRGGWWLPVPHALARYCPHTMTTLVHDLELPELDLLGVDRW